ncbi:MAG: hypothetical protein JW818_18935 [Pirellulales bacterium]|nr:hypothetical protein [Pirellulales bacterium]
MTTPTHNHLDYAEEAESAERGEAWPQAAALWRKAANALRETAAHTEATFDLHAKYQAAAEECDRKERVHQLIERIASNVLHIPTLAERKLDSLDFHEVGVWQIKKALAVAYEAGRNDAN